VSGLARTHWPPADRSISPIGESFQQSACRTASIVPERRLSVAGVQWRDRSGGGAQACGLGKGQSSGQLPEPGRPLADHDQHFFSVWAAAAQLLQRQPSCENSSRTWAFAPGPHVHHRSSRSAKGLHVNEARHAQQRVQPPPAQPPALQPLRPSSRFSSAGLPKASRGRPCCTRAMRCSAGPSTRSRGGHHDRGPPPPPGWEHVPEVAARTRIHSSGGLHRSSNSMGSRSGRSRGPASFAHCTGEWLANDPAKGLQTQASEQEPRAPARAPVGTSRRPANIAQVSPPTWRSVLGELLGQVANSAHAARGAAGQPPAPGHHWARSPQRGCENVAGFAGAIGDRSARKDFPGPRTAEFPGPANSRAAAVALVQPHHAHHHSGGRGIRGEDFGIGGHARFGSYGRVAIASLRPNTGAPVALEIRMSRE